MPLTLIALTGNINSGKTTVSEYLQNTWGFTEYTFSKPIKEMALIFGFEHHQVYGTQVQKLEINADWSISAREFLQKFGTDICRESLSKTIPDMNFGESNSPWIRLFEIYIKKYIEQYPNGCIVVSDIRFLDEAAVIKKLGGCIVRIDRVAGIQRTDEHNLDSHDKHSSETEMLNITADFTIFNTGTKDALYNQITEIVDNVIHTILI